MKRNWRLVTCRVPLILLSCFLKPASLRASCSYVDPGISMQGYVNWCNCIGGTPHDVGYMNVGCTPPAGGGVPAPSFAAPNFQQEMELQMAQQLGGMIGQMFGSMLHAAIFGNPQQEARQQAEIEAYKAEQRRQQELLAAEAAREREERHQNLMSALKEVGGNDLALKDVSSGDLPLKTGNDFFGINTDPSGAEGADELMLKTGDESVLSRDPSAEFNEAAYLAAMASSARSPADAKALLEAAYEAAAGKTRRFEVPPDVAAKPVNPEKLVAFKRIREDHQAAEQKEREARDRLKEAEYKKRVADKVREEAEKKREEVKLQPPPQPQEQKPPDIQKEPEAQQEDLNKLLQEAIDLDNKMTEELRNARQGLDEAERNLRQAETKTKDFVKGLGT